MESKKYFSSKSTKMFTLLAFASIAFVSIFAAPTKSLFGAKNANSFDDTQAFENPYITDGLVAMWDGEWNAAVGVHDANAATWKDLSGNKRDLQIVQNGSIAS